MFREDLPSGTEQERRQMIPVLKAVHKAGMKATMKGHKVPIEGKLYGMNDINSIPANAHPRKSAESEDDSGIFFSGRFSPFSNFLQATFEIEGRKFKTSEQSVLSI